MVKDVNLYYNDNGELYCFQVPHDEIATSIFYLSNYLRKISDDKKKEMMEAIERQVRYWLLQATITKRTDKKIISELREAVIQYHCLRYTFYKIPIPLLEF